MTDIDKLSERMTQLGISKFQMDVTSEWYSLSKEDRIKILNDILDDIESDFLIPVPFDADSFIGQKLNKIVDIFYYHILFPIKRCLINKTLKNKIFNVFKRR